MYKLRNFSKTIVFLVAFMMVVTASGLAAPLHRSAYALGDYYFYYYDNLPGSTNNQQFKYSNSPITIRANTYTNAGYRFMGWNTRANGTGRMYQPGDRYYVGVGTLVMYLGLYAQWAKIVNVNYSANASGATGSVSDTAEYISGDAVTLQANAYTRGGYRFTGWNTSADGSGTRVMAGADYTITDTDAANGLTFYAQWESETVAGTVDIPATGDPSNWVLYFTIALANAGALLTILIIRKRQRI